MLIDFKIMDLESLIEDRKYCLNIRNYLTFTMPDIYT